MTRRALKKPSNLRGFIAVFRFAASVLAALFLLDAKLHVTADISFSVCFYCVSRFSHHQHPRHAQCSGSNHCLPSLWISLQDDFNALHHMTSQAYPQPTFMASSVMAFGPAQPVSVASDTASGMVRARPLSVTINLNAISNLVVADTVSQINPTRASVSRNTSSISAEIYSSIGNASVNALIEVERRGAERKAQVQTVTKSIRDLTTNCTEARTPRTARPAFTRRPLSTMTSTTNTPLRRASGDLRSLH